MTDDPQETIRIAQNAVHHARELRENESAQWLFGVLKNRCDQMADDILHDNKLSPEDREALRRERLGILESLRTADEQEEAQTRVLASNGVKV